MRSSWFARIVGAIALAFAFIAAPAHAQNYSDIWWNPNESGWGLTIADHESQLFAVWFTYRQDGKPTWFVIPGGTLSSDHKHFQGDVYTTTGPAYSAATFDPTRVTVTKVGTATLDFASFGAATFAYNVAGVAQTKQIQRQPFGNATPLWGVNNDVTDIWWNSSESGWGLTLAQHGNNVFGVWFTYDTDGQPLWVVMPGVTFNGTTSFTGNLFTTTGPSFTATQFDPSQVVVTLAGNSAVTLTQAGASAQCAGTQAAGIQWSLRGASRQTSICHQPFGNARPVAFDFPDAPGLLDGDALFQAPADPVNVVVSTDDTRAATALITAAGGSLTTTDANGNRYTLTLPAHAVGEDTNVTMTPISTLTGLAYASGVVAGVKLDPDGIVLGDNATLTITPAVAFPPLRPTGFAATGEGKDLHYAPPGPDFAQMQLSVGHFSFWGWLFMSPAERLNEMRMKLAQDNRSRLEHWVAAYLEGMGRKQIGGTTDVNDPPPSINQVQAWFDSYRSLVIQPLLLSAKTSCLDATKAFDAVQYISDKRRDLGTLDIAQMMADMEQLRIAYGSLVAKTPCFFEETATFTDNNSDAVSTIHAQWRITEQSGSVYTYKPLKGSIELEYKADGCTVIATDKSIDASDGVLVIDWGSRAYHGAAMHKVPILIKCGDGPTVGAPYPVFYLGLLTEATGTVSGNGTIASQTLTGDNLILEHHFDLCSENNALYCGNGIEPP